MVGKKHIKKFALPALAIFVLLSVVFAYSVNTLHFDYDFEKFFPSEDEETTYFFEHREKFESDNDFLLIALENKKGIFDSTFLQEVDRLTEAIDTVKFIESVLSITRQKEIIVPKFGPVFKRQYIHLDSLQLEKDSARIFHSEELLNTLVAKDAKSVCLFVKHEEYISKNKSDQLIRSIKSVLQQFSFDRKFLAGRTVGQQYYIQKMTFVMLLFLALSTILIIVFLFIAFRSGWGIILPSVVLIGSILWVLGGMGLFQQPINILLTTLPSILFVVGMSDVIHFVSKYLDSKRELTNTLDALVQAIKEIGLATLLTSITTAIGFFSLYFVNVEPIRIYGVILGIGVLVAFVLTFLTLPALIYFFPAPRYIEKNPKEHFWKKYLEKWFLRVLQNRKTVLGIWACILLISCIGMFQIKADNLLMDDMRESEPIKQEFNYLDKHYGGVRPFELAVELKDTSKSFWDYKTLQELGKLEKYVENKYKAEIKQSLTQTIKVLHRSSHFGDTNYYSIPKSKQKIHSYKRKISMANQGKIIRLLLDSAEQTTRITGGIGDLGNKFITNKNKKLHRFIAQNLDTSLITVNVTGTAHLLDKNMRYLSTSLIKGLLFSVGIVALIIGFIYRSARILLISLVPNLFPLIVLGGIMGFTGIELKTSTAIIFTIAFGIAVDDTIHFLGKFKYELMQGKSKLYALKQSYMTTGKAMILTSLILCSGFLLLTLSSFLGTFYMGLLICITLFVALILDLTVLPVLLLLFFKK